MAEAYEIQTLKAFVSVARTGSVSAAALGMHLSQPAVSLQIKSLQERSGVQLFQRTPKGLVLTRDGAALLPQAEKVLAAVHDFAQAAQSLQTTVRGTLRVGTILDPEFTRLGEFLRHLVEGAPQIQTELRQGMSGQVLAQVVAQELDVGFYLATPGEIQENRLQILMGYGKNASELIAIPLGSFTYRVLAPAGWGPQVRGMGWRELASLPWITTPQASAHYRLLQTVYQGLGVAPRSAALVDQESSMLDLVRSGVGLSLARDTIAMREAQSRGLVIADKVSLSCELCFICMAQRGPDPLVVAAHDALRKAWL